jgi:hypothetical protein
MLEYLTFIIYTMFWGFIIKLILALKNSENKRTEESKYTFNIEDFELDDNDLNIVKTYLKQNNLLEKNLIVSFKNNIKTLCLLDSLKKINMLDNVNILYVNNNSDSDSIKLIELLHKLYGFKYNIIEYNSNDRVLDTKSGNNLNYILKESYSEYCKKMDTDIILYSEDQNSFCNDILKNIFTNRLDIVSDKNNYNDYTIYRPLFNLDIEPEIESTNMSDKLVEVIDSFKHHYPNWKNNLHNQISLLTREFNNNTVLHLNNAVNYYKNGFALNLIDVNIIDGEYCEIELRYLYTKICEYYNIAIYNTTMNKLFSISKDNICVKHDNWLFVYDDNRIVGMNYQNCQDFIDSCEQKSADDFCWDESNTNNCLVSFLNEDFFEYYYIDELNKNIKTSENILYENNIFSSKLLENFKFSKKEKGSYHMIDNK